MIPDDYALSNEQLAILAAYEDAGEACWYRHPEFRLLLEDGCGEFELMQKMAQELIAWRNGVAA
jgi:hypothetical protein